MHIFCFGDSNTYGFDPRSYMGGRYPAEQRWVSILARSTGHTLINAGENGRMIPRTAAGLPDIPPQTDMLIILLGTNDILQGASAAEAAARMEIFLPKLDIDREKILLIAPPPMKMGEWVTDEAILPASALLAAEYSALAERLGVRFADAGEWNVDLTYDGVHFSEVGHASFADGLQEYLRNFPQP